jgi:hypothetical protein
MFKNVFDNPVNGGIITIIAIVIFILSYSIYMLRKEHKKK